MHCAEEIERKRKRTRTREMPALNIYFQDWFFLPISCPLCRRKIALCVASPLGCVCVEGVLEKATPLGDGSWERPPSFINQGTPRHSPRLSLLTASLGWRWGTDCDGGRDGERKGGRGASLFRLAGKADRLCVYGRAYMHMCVCPCMEGGGVKAIKSPLVTKLSA